MSPMPTRVDTPSVGPGVGTATTTQFGIWTEGCPMIGGVSNENRLAHGPFGPYHGGVHVSATREASPVVLRTVPAPPAR
jgi:hypothetical protein